MNHHKIHVKLHVRDQKKEETWNYSVDSGDSLVDVRTKVSKFAQIKLRKVKMKCTSCGRKAGNVIFARRNMLKSLQEGDLVECVATCSNTKCRQSVQADFCEQAEFLGLKSVARCKYCQSFNQARLCTLCKDAIFCNKSACRAKHLNVCVEMQKHQGGG